MTEYDGTQICGICGKMCGGACYDSDKMRIKRLESRLIAYDIGIVGKVCDKCGGSGRVMYGSTATYMGGIGGSAMTVGTCDKCWGSGDQSHPYVNLKDLIDDVRKLKAELDSTKLRVYKLLDYIHEGPEDYNG